MGERQVQGQGTYAKNPFSGRGSSSCSSVHQLNRLTDPPQVGAQRAPDPETSHHQPKRAGSQPPDSADYLQDQSREDTPRRNHIPLWLTDARLFRERHQGLECLICSDFRRIELSFQSTFHLSLTVLVCYRTREDHELQTKYTAQLALPSQATRLADRRHYAGHRTRSEQGCHLVFRPFHGTYARGPASHASPQRKWGTSSIMFIRHY